MRRMALLVGCAAMLAACGDDNDDGDNNPPANTIQVVNNDFTPSTLTVPVGTTVTFDWPSGSLNHNVIPLAANPEAVPASPGQPDLLSGPTSFQATFNSAGTYQYYCSVHGSVDTDGQPVGMAGSITVE
ncbi:MAG: plastocyanin/azurin family copper-binding protein [Gemmatimonadales bacterium]